MWFQGLQNSGFSVCIFSHVVLENWRLKHSNGCYLCVVVVVVVGGGGVGVVVIIIVIIWGGVDDGMMQKI
jgi:hypothetical protein